MTHQQLTCHILFGPVRAEQIRRAVEEDTGQMCPCIRGLCCPLAPQDSAAELESVAHAS